MQATIQTSTPDLAKTIAFYEKLDFELYQFSGRNFATDGKIWIEINPAPTARAGIKFYLEDYNDRIKDLPEGRLYSIQDSETLIGSPSGIKLFLAEANPEVELNLSENPFGLCGKTAGASLEVLDLKTELEFWQQFGFEKSAGAIEQGWVALQHQNGFGLSMMKPYVCPHSFANPSITYFNGGKNLPVIHAIRERQIPILEEISIFNDEGVVDWDFLFSMTNFC